MLSRTLSALSRGFATSFPIQSLRTKYSYSLFSLTIEQIEQITYSIELTLLAGNYLHTILIHRQVIMSI